MFGIFGKIESPIGKELKKIEGFHGGKVKILGKELSGEVFSVLSQGIEKKESIRKAYKSGANLEAIVDDRKNLYPIIVEKLDDIFIKEINLNIAANDDVSELERDIAEFCDIVIKSTLDVKYFDKHFSEGDKFFDIYEFRDNFYNFLDEDSVSEIQELVSLKFEDVIESELVVE